MMCLHVLKRLAFPLCYANVALVMMAGPLLVESVSWEGYFGRGGFDDGIPDSAVITVYYIISTMMLAFATRITIRQLQIIARARRQKIYYDQRVSINDIH